MKTLDSMPTTGQFVAVYEYNNEVWSSTYKWEDGKLLTYNEKPDEFFLDLKENIPYGDNSYKYFVY